MIKKVNKTHVAIVLDRSGSMKRAHQQTIDYYNEQLGQMIENSKTQEITLSVVTFNKNVFEHEWLSNPVDMAEITPETYVPQGSTALIDAIGYTIDKLKKTVVDDKNTGYLVLIVSDGEDTEPYQHYTRSQVRSLIDECQATERWNISYMGCSSACLKEVQRDFGIKPSNMAAWSNANVAVADHSLKRATSKVADYYRHRTLGSFKTSKLYSDDEMLAANFVSESESALPVYSSVNVPEIDLSKVVYGTKHLSSGNKVAWQS